MKSLYYMSYKIASVSLVRHASMHSVRPPAPEIYGWDSLQTLFP